MASKKIMEVRKRAKIRKLMQSSTTPDPGYQWKSDNVTIRRDKRALFMSVVRPSCVRRAFFVRPSVNCFLKGDGNPDDYYGLYERS